MAQAGRLAVLKEHSQVSDTESSVEIEEAVRTFGLVTTVEFESEIKTWLVIPF